ncbi:MAG: carbonic anhydrase [Deltaproteobacteria bacterium]|nr:carbonic anhydrase [Deltaproteobacteria bacterium]
MANRHDEDHQRHLTRRGFCAYGVLAGVAASGLGAGLARAAEPLPAADTPAAALERLRAGQARFVAGAPIAPNRDLAQLRAVAPKQEPFAAVLACADSRVPVEVVYDQGFGDLFVVRVAGNIATAVEIASLEYSVAVLGAEVIKVVGHSNCGAVKAALAGDKVPGQISTLYQHIVPALQRGSMSLDEAIAANVRYQVRKLREASPLLAKVVGEGKLVIEGGVFDFASGTVAPV